MELYNRPDIIGRMSKVYFSPPLSPHSALSSPTSRQSYETLQTPRLTLRFLANYQTLFYIGLVYLALRFMVGMGTVYYIPFLLLCVLVYGFLRATLVKDDVKME